MAFIGLITRKETETGVNLLAKIVSPSKKKSVYKTIPVRIKSNGLSDFDCCTIDLGTVNSKLNRDYNFDKLDQDIILINNGEHGTDIKYEIINSDDTTSSDPSIANSNNPEYLTTYLDINGHIKSKPLFGNDAISGSIKITVSKNEASVSRTVAVTLQSITASEVLANTTTASKVKLFSELIQNNRNPYNETQDVGIKTELGYGDYGAINVLHLIDSIKDSKLSTIPINIKWTFEDATSSFAKSMYTRPDDIKNIDNIDQTGRIFINNTDKKAYISTPSYEAICSQINSLTNNDYKNYFSKGFGDVTNTNSLKIKISGLTIKAKLTLSNNDETDKAEATYEYYCKTSSLYLRSTELMNTLVKPNMKVFVLNIDKSSERTNYIKKKSFAFNGANNSANITYIGTDDVVYEFDETDTERVTSANLYLGVFGGEGLAIHLSDNPNTWLTDRNKVEHPERYKDYYLLDNAKLSGIAINDDPLLLNYNTELDDVNYISHTYPLFTDTNIGNDKIVAIEQVNGLISGGNQQELKVIKIDMLKAFEYLKGITNKDEYTKFILKSSVTVSYNSGGINKDDGANLKSDLFTMISISVPSFNDDNHIVN